MAGSTLLRVPKDPPHLLRVGGALELGEVRVGVDRAQEDGLELVHARIAAGGAWVAGVLATATEGCAAAASGGGAANPAHRPDTPAPTASATLLLSFPGCCLA